MKKINLLFLVLLFTSITFAQYTSDYTGAEIDAGIRPYKVYSALLTQTGTDAPVATVLENTIGNIVWSRYDAGDYIGTLADAFTIGKTACLINQFLGTFQGSTIFFQELVLNSENIVGLNTYIYDTGEWGKSDDMLTASFIEIRVYP